MNFVQSFGKGISSAIIPLHRSFGLIVVVVSEIVVNSLVFVVISSVVVSSNVVVTVFSVVVANNSHVLGLP
jgi:hypothetical protein